MLCAVLLMLSVGCFAQTCSKNINTCCTIHSPGAYNVVSDLTAHGSCIEVESGHTQLFTNGYNITGNGSGVGILVEAEDVLLMGVGRVAVPNPTPGVLGAISHFKTGVEVDGEHATVEGFSYYYNGTGVLLNSHGARLNYFEAWYNQVAVFVHGDRNLVGSGSVMAFNTVAGVVLDCRADGNMVLDNELFNNGVGIFAYDGSNRNTIAGNWSWSNTVNDMYDGNRDADNSWEVSSFTSANRSYIH